MMNGIRYTYKTHYKIAEFYEKAGTIMNLLVAGGTAVLVGLIIWRAVSQQWLVSVAVVVAVLAWVQVVLKLGETAQEHYAAGDRHHSLYESFRDFVKVDLPDDDIPLHEKQERFRSLSEKRDQTNQLSPRTTNFWYRRVRGDIDLATAEVSSDEIDAILDES